MPIKRSTRRRAAPKAAKPEVEITDPMESDEVVVSLVPQVVRVPELDPASPSGDKSVLTVVDVGCSLTRDAETSDTDVCASTEASTVTAYYDKLDAVFAEFGEKYQAERVERLLRHYLELIGAEPVPESASLPSEEATIVESPTLCVVAPSAQDAFTKFVRGAEGMECMDLRLPTSLSRLHSVMQDRLHRAFVAGWNQRGDS